MADDLNKAKFEEAKADFLREVDEAMRKYNESVNQLLRDIDSRKLESLKKDLNI